MSNLPGERFPWVVNHQLGCHHQFLFWKDDRQPHFLLLSCLLFLCQILEVVVPYAKVLVLHLSFAGDISMQRDLCGQ